MLSACYNIIDDKTVSGMFKNLTAVDIDWRSSFDSLVEIDYSKLKPSGGVQNLDFTPEQQILFYKVEKAREEFISVNKVKQQQTTSQPFTIFGINFAKLSKEVKTFSVLGFFAVFIAGVIFLLVKLNKSNEKPKKKKKNI